MNKYDVVKLFLAIILILIVFLLYRSNYLDWQLNTFGISMNVKDYRVVELSHFIFQGRKNTDITAKKNGEIMRVKIIEQINKETAEKYIEDIFHRLEFHFIPEEILAVYADILTAIITLPAEIIPLRNETKVMDKTIPYYIAYTDEQLSYLIFSPSDVKYKSLLTLIFCDKKSMLVSVEILMPLQQFNLEKTLGLLHSFRC